MADDDRFEPTFERLPEGTGFSIVDPIERRRYVVETPSAVDPSPIADEPFDVPVDSTAVFTAEGVVLPEVVDVFIHEADGHDVTRVQPVSEIEFPDGRYHVEVSGPIKVYVELRGRFVVTASIDEIAFDCGARRDVLIGARSHHERPTTTLRTTPDPRDVMETVSYLGSALKSTSPERSYPTLRGHPPAIEIGERLRVPSTLERPDTGVTLELPADLAAVFAASPLAYYLGANVEPAAEPRLVTDAGFEHSLSAPGDGFEADVERVLKQVFLLDCVVRTEGHYRITLHERDVIESRVDLDVGDLYDRPLPRQLETYLDVDFDVVEDLLPRWPLTAHVPPDPPLVEALPYVVNDLAIVRSATAHELSAQEVRTEALHQYLAGGELVRSSEESQPVRSERDANDGLRVVQLSETNSQDDAWFGDGVALHATKAIIKAYRNRLDRRPREGPIELSVVCNDGGMADENDVASDVYGSRTDLPFDVTFHRNLTVAELGEVLASGTDFLHYIGHIDDDGFQCRDGMFDATTADSVGVDAFFLNACRSYRQGIHLIEAGATGGVVTISDVINTSAVRVGHAMARLLNLGFPLRSALTLARGESVVGSHYIVVGDGSADLVSARNAVPLVCDVSEVGDEYDLTIRVFVPKEGGVGGTFIPTIRDNGVHYLIPGELGTFRLSETTLREYLTWHPYPVRTEKGLVWNDTEGEFDL